MSKKTNLEEMKMQLNRIEHYIRISTEKKYFPDPAPECTCREFYIKPCPLHPYDLKVEIKKDSEPPLKAQGDGYYFNHETGERTYKPYDPDPPLNARVEKVLGEEIQYFWDYGWLVKDIDRRGPSDLIRGEFWRKPYKRDTDRDLAIGALEKYREMHYPDAFPIMILENRYRSYSGGEWTVVIGAKNKQQIIDGIYGDDLEAVDFSIAVNRDGLPVVAADSLPEAICRAIVKHAEGR